MADYDLEARADAVAELAPIAQGGSGQTVTLHQPVTDGVYDPATDTVTGASLADDHEGSGVELQYDARSIDGTVILAGDVKFVLSPEKTDGTLMPQPVADVDTLVYGGKTWTIKRVNTLSPAGNIVLFELQLRGV